LKASIKNTCLLAVVVPDDEINLGLSNITITASRAVNRISSRKFILSQCINSWRYPSRIFYVVFLPVSFFLSGITLLLLEFMRISGHIFNFAGPVVVLIVPDLSYEGWNFKSGNYLFTTDTK